jgi:signal transduction histidine kinase
VDSDLVERAGGAPVHGPKARRNPSLSPLGRLPLVAKILSPIFAMTLCIGLGAAIFFTGQQVEADRVNQAAEGRAIAVLARGALEAMPDDPARVEVFLRSADVAYRNVGAICVLKINQSDLTGPLLVYASSGPSSNCDLNPRLIPGPARPDAVSALRQVPSGQVEETTIGALFPGLGELVVVEVQVRLTPYVDVALPMYEKVGGTGLLLAVFQTGLVFVVLWIWALRPLKNLRLKASATTRGARPSSLDGSAAPDRSGDEIHDLSLRFEEMLGAVRDRELELVESHEKLETLISNSPVLVFSTDKDGILLQVQGNKVGSIATDTGGESLVGMSLLQVVHANTQLSAVIYRALSGEKVHEVVSVRNWMSGTPSMVPVHLDLLMTPTLDSEGRQIGITGLAVDVSDRMDAASARAESQQKSAFLAAMSHELRTPLNSIMGFSQLLEMPLGSAALTVKQRRYVGHIHSSGEHLLALVSDILDLAKVGAGQIEVNLEEVAVHAEVQDPVDKMRPLAARKGLTIEVDVPLELTSFTDRLRVRQIILNLLSNAVKFTPPEGGPIRVTGTVSGEGIEIAVADSGIGIALEEQVRIFDEFTQVDRGPSRRLDGTGLGLTLTKKMAEIVGGSVRVASKLGHGSTFTVWLPGVVARGDARPLAASTTV